MTPATCYDVRYSPDTEVNVDFGAKITDIGRWEYQTAVGVMRMQCCDPEFQINAMTCLLVASYPNASLSN